jgi:hypothetical protein
VSNVKLAKSERVEPPLSHQLVLYMREEMTAAEREGLIAAILGNFYRDGAARPMEP